MITWKQLTTTSAFPSILFGLSVAAVCASTPSSAGEVKARAAFDFVNAIGVNTHFDWGPSLYRTQYAQAKAALAELGVKHIRDVVGTTNSTTVYRDLNTNLGVRVTAMIDVRKGSGAGQRLDVNGIQAKIDQARTQMGTKALAAIEGPNEYNLLERDYGYQGWVGELRTYQQQLYNRVKADGVLRSVPVVAPALGGPNEGIYYAKLGNLSSSITYGGAHIYPNWMPFAQRTDQIMPNIRMTSPSQQVWVTETGWHQAFSSGAQWLPDDALLKYLGRAMADYSTYQPLGKAFYYQLIDPYANAANTVTALHFGLIDSSMRRKPSFYAVRNTMYVMCDNPLGAAPKTLRYALSGNLSNVRTLLYQKQNGAFYLMFWIEKQSYNRGQAIVNPPQALTITFEQSIQQARTYLPTGLTGGIVNGNLPKQTFSQPTKLNLNATDAITVLEIVPSGTAIPAVPTRCDFNAV